MKNSTIPINLTTIPVKNSNSAVFRVKRPGPLTTVQDLGRNGYQSQGVRVCGAADEYSHRVANALVGNSGELPTLEFAMLGPELTTLRNCTLAYYGADFDFKINNVVAPYGRPIRVKAKSTLSFNQSKSGMFAYLSVAGGFKIDPIMGSSATDITSDFPGLLGRRLMKDDLIDQFHDVTQPEFIEEKVSFDQSGFGAPLWSVRPLIELWRNNEKLIRFIPNENWFSIKRADRDQFLSARYVVHADSNRMGIRFSGDSITLKRPENTQSRPVTFGSIQVPPNGQPIVLSVDRQSIGGYPTLGEVISIDRSMLVQLCPGDEVKFAEFDLENAQSALLSEAHQQKLLFDSIKNRLWEM